MKSTVRPAAMCGTEKIQPAHSEKKAARRRKNISLLCGILFLAAFVLLAVLVGPPVVDFVSNPERFRAFVAENGALAKLAFVGMMLFQVVVAVVPGEPLELGAGLAFGAGWGTALCLVGALCGSAAVFALTRALGRGLVESFFPAEKLERLAFLRDSKKRNLLVFILFFIPGSPKDMLTYFVGLTPMKLSHFLLLSTAARIPSVMTSTFGGDAYANGDYTLTAAVFALTALVSAAGVLAYRAIVRRENKEENPHA